MATSKTPRPAAAKKILPATVAPVTFGLGHMSANQLAKMLGRDRGTIDRWIKAKCPYVQAADRSAGKDWILDIGDVVKWREEKIAQEALQSRVDDGDAYDDPKDLVSLARMQLKLEEDRKQLVRQALYVARMERHHALVRQSVMTLPLKFLDLLQGLEQTEHNRLHGKLVDLCIDGLEDAAKVIKDYDASTSAAR